MATSQVKVRKALESTESLLTSLVDRSLLQPVSETDCPSPANDNRQDIPGLIEDASTRVLDVEQSLIGTGEALGTILTSPDTPTHTSADATADMLSSLVFCNSIRSSDQEAVSLDPIYLKEQLYEAEKNIRLSAKIGLALSKRVDFLEKEVTRLTEQNSGLDKTLNQARHELSRKDSLLKLYYIHNEENDNDKEVDKSSSEWVETIQEENTQLKKTNQELWEENVRLQQNAQATAEKEKTLVQQCFSQLSEAKQQLLEYQNAMESQEEDHHQLQTKLDETFQENEVLNESKYLLLEELDDLKEKVSESQLALSQAYIGLSEWQEKYDAVYTLMKNAQEENKMLKELTDTASSNGGSSTPTEGGEHHESIVQEIEEVLRRELIAASTLTDRPVSPNNYAKQRTTVVMETVKAATLATARKLEKLAAEQRKKEEDLNSQSSLLSPEDELSKGHQKYFSPQKLQIVKPMEGSVTLLRWKLLATPQLKGPSALLNETEGPGIHLKNYSSDSRPGSSLEVNRVTSDRKWHSVYDLSSTHNTIPHKVIHTRHIQRAPPIETPLTRSSQLSTVGKVKQNILGFLSPSGRDSSKKTTSNDTKGLEELLGP